MGLRDKAERLRDAASDGAKRFQPSEIIDRVDVESLKQTAIEGSGVTNKKGEVKGWRVAKAMTNPTRTAQNVAGSIGREAIRQGDLPAKGGVGDDGGDGSDTGNEVPGEEGELFVPTPSSRHWWMLGFSVVTLGFGLLAIFGGNLAEDVILGLVMIAAVLGAAAVSNLWTRVKMIPIGAKILVWAVAAVGAVISSFFVVILWVTLKLFKLFFAWAGVDIGKGPSAGALVRGVPRTRVRASSGGNSDWSRIVSSKRVGDERVVHDGGFTYIGGKRVMSEGGFTYVGDERVLLEDGVLRIGDKLVTRDAGHLYVDGKVVEE
ncbi:MAG: hypothetical protein AB1673_15360 [Actinomycetota bacterium]